MFCCCPSRISGHGASSRRVAVARAQLGTTEVTSLLDLPKLIQPKANQSSHVRAFTGDKLIHLGYLDLLRLFGGWPKSSSLNIPNKMGGLKMGDFHPMGSNPPKNHPKSKPKDTVDGSEILLTGWGNGSLSEYLIGFFTSKRWLFGISEPSTVWPEKSCLTSPTWIFVA